ncbi:NUDIX hydrolase [Desulfococcaceae bacterium HSG7]|nr:NUDIX hydrolase [Desulfococcaceae bacterium HSG7]
MEIKKIDKITDNIHLNLFQIAYSDRNGNEKKWQIASRLARPKCVTGKFNIPDAVVIVPFHQKKKKLVVIKEFRVPLGGYQYGFPAGLIDENETLEEASRRELKEETGLNLRHVGHISPPLYSSSGMTDESVAMVFAECDGEPSNQLNESSEDISVIFVSPTQARQMLNQSELKFDVKTWLVLDAYAKGTSSCKIP